MSQEIGVWLKGLRIWNVFIFLDLVIGTFGGGKWGRDLACTLSWKVLEWNREVRILMVAGEWEAMRKGVFLTDSGWESWYQLSSQGHCRFSSQQNLACYEVSMCPCVSPLALWEMSSSHYTKLRNGLPLCRAHDLWRGRLARHKTEAERGRKKEIRRTEKRGKRTEHKSQEEENGQKRCMLWAIIALELGKRWEGTTSEDICSRPQNCWASEQRVQDSNPCLTSSEAHTFYLYTSLPHRTTCSSSWDTLWCAI